MDHPTPYVPLDPETVEENTPQNPLVHAKTEDDEEVAYGATKEVGPHLIVAVKGRLGDRQVWMCRECDARREHAYEFAEVECQ